MTRVQRVAVGLALTVAAFTWAATFLRAEASTIRFVPGWAKMPAGEWEIARVAADPKGSRFFAFRRSDPPIIEFDPESGRVLAEWGAGLVVAPHGMYVDREGFLWVTDAGHLGLHKPEAGLMPPIASAEKAGRGYQVFKFAPDRRIVLTLGKQGVKGNGPDTLSAPSDVVVGNNGDIFVADGHEGGEMEYPRIVKFSKDGRFIKQWGKKGTGPGEFGVPHALVIDSRGRLLVGDRPNKRISLFTQDGEFLEQWTQMPRPSGLAIGPNDTLYVTDIDRKVIVVASAKDGSVRELIPDVWAEGVTADAKGNVYAGEVYRRSIKKFVVLGALSPVSRR